MQARENRDTHVAQCAAEVAKIVHVNKLAAENAKSSVDREAAQIEGRRIKIAELEAESVRIFEVRSPNRREVTPLHFRRHSNSVGVSGRD